MDAVSEMQLGALMARDHATGASPGDIVDMWADCGGLRPKGPRKHGATEALRDILAEMVGRRGGRDDSGALSWTHVAIGAAPAPDPEPDGLLGLLSDIKPRRRDPWWQGLADAAREALEGRNLIPA